MAISLQASIAMVLSDGVLSIPFQPNLGILTPASFKNQGRIWTVGTTEETLSLGDVTDPWYLCLYNGDATNFVELGRDSGGAINPDIHLEPGDFAIFPLKSGITFKALADTAPVDLYMLLMSR